MNQGKQLLSNFKFYSGNYSFYREDLNRHETWKEAVSDRVMAMHKRKYQQQISNSKKLREYVDFAEKAYLEKLVLGSQRALQFGGRDIEKHESKMYNCLTSYADRVEFFREAMYWLLSGCGIGFRVLPKDIDQLPDVMPRTKGYKTFVVADSIEGWSDANDVLISSYMDEQYATRPEYSGYEVIFDLSQVRRKGALISGRFKAPGPDGLEESLKKISQVIEAQIKSCADRKIASRLRPIDVYDIVMHMSDAVLSGGVRRSATICLFHHLDTEMLNAKTYENFRPFGDNPLNPQRARSNNSAMLIRGEVSRQEFHQVMKSVRDWGEPGFVWTDSYDIIFNPCVEIGMYPQLDGKSGWQGCNLAEINGGQCNTEEEFYRACKAAAVLGTLQAGYTNFRYVKEHTRKIFEREALLGCSITGFANNPKVLFDPEIQRTGAKIIKEVNKEVASLIGINPAARTTCVKPSGNASVLLGTASGIHGEHHTKYFRQVQVNKTEEVPEIIRQTNPEMFEESVWSANKTDWVVAFPIETSNEDSLFKSNLLGVKQLELVKLTQQNWVEAGTDPELCVIKNIRHNVSNTIQVDDWDEVEEYIYENREYFAGISLLSNTGDKDYAQAPFVAVYEPEQILKEYGDCSLFASGLIVDAMHAFNNNLWRACDIVLNDEKLNPDSDNALKIDWIRRFKKFAQVHLDNDLKKTSYLLKDVYNYHKWKKLTSKVVDLDWENIDLKPSYADMDTMGSAACAGGACEIQF